MATWEWLVVCAALMGCVGSEAPSSSSGPGGAGGSEQPGGSGGELELGGDGGAGVGGEFELGGRGGAGGASTATCDASADTSCGCFAEQLPADVPTCSEGVAGWTCADGWLCYSFGAPLLEHDCCESACAGSIIFVAGFGWSCLL